VQRVTGSSPGRGEERDGSYTVTLALQLEYNTYRQPCVMYLATADKYILLKTDIMLEAFVCVACNKDK
jgi:hypothetical protein